MKKLLCIVLVCLLLCACGKTQSESVQPTTEPPYEAQQPTLSPTEPEGTDEEILAYRRSLVTAEMRRCMSTLWTPAEDITYYVKADDSEPITMLAGRVYQGLPYTHGSGSVYSFLNYATAQDEDGIYTITGMGSDQLSGGNYARQGCDCADTVFWAWSQVSNSFTAKATNYMTESYGLVRVGDYTCSLPRYASSTKPVCQENGQEVMFASYAQMQPGDALVLYTNSAGGHAVMAMDIVVKYTDDGQIDGEASYVMIIEQTSGPQREEEHYYDDYLEQNIYVCGAVDSLWTFDTLFQKGYLPVTCKELVDPSPLVPESVSFSGPSISLDNLQRFSFEATRRIAQVTLTITQKDNIVQQITVYGTEDNYSSFSLMAFVDPLERAVAQGSFDPDALKPGDYHCTVTTRLATGNTHTVCQFDYVK